MDIDLNRWDEATAEEREALAVSVARALDDFDFVGLETFELGDQARQVALFESDAGTFALVPGGPAKLGFDPSEWTPTDLEAASWLETAEEWADGEAIEAFVGRSTTPVREVELAPMLVETEPFEPGWMPVDTEDEAVQRALEDHASVGTVELHRDDGVLRIERHDDGLVTAERSTTLTLSAITEHFEATGFRLLTSDEWEYACGGGASTLFRWGDHGPGDHYPTDVSPEEAAWRKAWVRSMGKLEYPAEGFVRVFDRHLVPNAFGLHIADDPYKCELVAEPGRTRGGDGGSAVCGGLGSFVGWLTLATAYFDEETCVYDASEPLQPGFSIVRRVRTVVGV